jgi:Initiator Replication protein
MRLKKVAQKSGHDDFAKARELIEIRDTDTLTLQDRRIINLLYANAGPRLCEDVRHVIGIADLRGNHRGGERVKDSIKRLMDLEVRVPDLDQKGNSAFTVTRILAGSTITVDEDNPSGQVIYSFSKEMRDIIRDSTLWGRVRHAVVSAFTSKYALSLYELITARVNMTHVFSEEFSVDRLRAQLGVKPDKLTRVPNLLQRVIIPAVLEVNGLADFHVEIHPIRKGGRERGLVTGFKVRWGSKSKEEIISAFQELNQPKVGRMARLKARAGSKSLTSPVDAL